MGPGSMLIKPNYKKAPGRLQLLHSTFIIEMLGLGRPEGRVSSIDQS